MLTVLGVYCLIGGGQTPILAAGFKTLAEQFDVSLSKMSLTTGVYMLFLGFGSVILSPTAILYGKRPGICFVRALTTVYLLGQLIFIVGAVWCATAPSWTMLLIGRMITGIGVSPCESLPSSSIAEVPPPHCPPPTNSRSSSSTNAPSA
jgi:MFS family permease